MQNIVIDKPYQFVPPKHGSFWPWVFRHFLKGHLRKQYGIESVSIEGTAALRQSLQAGHGVLLAPNHCRPCDPMVLGLLAREVHCNTYIMASWHLFMQGGFQRWLLPRLGVFSVYREGMDMASIKTAMQVLVDAKRPLVIFPEGIVSRTNDRLGHLIEGTAFIARSAARQRAKADPAGKVVIHPVALRYTFDGDLDAAIGPVLAEIERRLTWPVQVDMDPVDRIARIGGALLGLKEIEHTGGSGTGSLEERQAALIEHILAPLEAEWEIKKKGSDTVSRVRALRAAILPDMVKGELDEAERQRRWKQMGDLYLTQQLSLYPADYIRSRPAPDRLLETVERFEEDLTDVARVHRPMRVRITVGEALPVEASKPKGVPHDPLMDELRESLETMLADE